MVASGSFAIAFGQEKISQWISLPSTSNSSCLEQFYRDIPPYLMKDSLKKTVIHCVLMALMWVILGIQNATVGGGGFNTEASKPENST